MNAVLRKQVYLPLRGVVVRGATALRALSLRRMARLGAALIACIAGTVAMTAPAHGQVLAVLSDASAGYDTVAAELESGLVSLPAGKAHVDRVIAARLGDISADAFGRYELVVTIGLAAAQATLAREAGHTDAPSVLCVLIPRQSFEPLSRDAEHGGARRPSALFIDQPLARQFDLLRAALPERQRAGTILGPTSKRLGAELFAAAGEHGLTLSSTEIEQASELYGALQHVVPQSDVLLLQPDPVAVNPDTVYGLLLASYRAQLPVVGFSEGLLNAGALLSLYSTAHQQGRQAAEIVVEALSHGVALPPPQYPKYFTVKVNASVARSLGLRVPTGEALEATLGSADAARVPAARSGASAKGAAQP